jgi:regulator of PEP synthase PpsR (kinase-PPPase family)
LPPPPPPPNKKFVVKVSREVTDLLSTEVEVEAPDKAAAIKAAEELYDQDKIALEYEMQLDDGKTTEYEVKSEADLEETPKEPPS